MTITYQWRLLRVLLGACMIAACSTPGSGRAQVALVIGNSAYVTLAKLPICDTSANLAAAALTRAGFRVSKLANPSNARMGSAIAALGDDIAASPGTPAVIYVCGYVAGYSDRLFLLPVEARMERETDVLSQGIVARALLSAATAGNAAALVLIDVASRQPTDLAATETLARPADLAHAGFAAARIAPAGDQIAAPLAAGLAEMLGGGDVELIAAMGELSKARAGLLTVRPPSSPIWLVGRSPGASATLAKPPPVAATPTATATAAAAATATAAATTAAMADPNPADRRRLQLELQRLGYYRGQIDGLFERETVAAIRQMQRESSEEPTGRLTASQIKRLFDH